ncbi:hypothetical protein L7F22_031356 [Adiantum nelumboides]|nr:hypothetical protein [Adiantum nelumboides]
MDPTQLQEPPGSNASSSSSSSSSFATSGLRERRNYDKGGELQPLHPGPLRELEFDAEEFVLAFIKESNPLRYVGCVLKSWCNGGWPPLSSHGISASKLNLSVDSPSLETSEHTRSRYFRLRFPAMFSILFLKSLLSLARPFELLGNAFEYHVNLTYMNHGLKKTLHTCLFDRGSLRKPSSGDDDYYSVTMLLDPRQDLQIQEDVLSDVSMLDTDAGIKNLAELCVMASKMAYENEKVIKNVVESSWKMNFVQYFDCWNDYLEYNATQAFIFTDKKQDATIVVVAFRGTQLFNMYDWCTDFDFSYYVLPEIGRVHVGFLEALGLGSRLRRETLKQAKINTIMKANKLTPTNTPTSGLREKPVAEGGKVLGYDAICSKVRVLLRENLGAKLYITGHSLGGALATLFSALLFIEENEACSRLGGVFTFGQPRVGDAKFASYMEKKLCGKSPKVYFRVVYRTDIVPRLPFDDRVFQFKHISPCHYYASCLKSMALFEEPYKDFILVMLQPMPHFSAIKELLASLLSRIRGRDHGYVETGLALVMRFVAMICPGLCAHFPSNYVDAVRGAPSSFLLEAVSFEKRSWSAVARYLPRLSFLNWSVLLCIFLVFFCI